MGCSCVLDDLKGNVDTGRFSSLSSQFKSNPKLLFILVRIQSRFRGLSLRKKFNLNSRHKKFISEEMSRNSTVQNINKYTPISESKIKESDIHSLFSSYPKLNDDVSVELRQTVVYDNQAEYYGEWDIKSNKRHGRGIQIWLDGSKYEGYWKNDKANLRGKLIHADGDMYEGGWEDDKAGGYGVYVHNDGARYEGYWKNDKQDGRGKETWLDGTSYEGDYVNGMKCGKGIFKWNDGSIYTGDFIDNNIEGKGIYVWNDKRQYNGSWKNNKMDGEGEFNWPDGRRYQGGYKEDKKEGYGIFLWSDGKIYRGFWKNGKQHGEGELFSNINKKWKKGIWNEGKRIKWVDVNGAVNENNDKSKININGLNSVVNSNMNGNGNEIEME